MNYFGNFDESFFFLSFFFCKGRTKAASVTRRQQPHPVCWIRGRRFECPNRAMRRRTRCMDGTTRTAARSRLQAEMGLRSSWVVVTSSFLLRSLCLGPEINSFHTPKLTFCLFPRVLSPKRCCSSQRGFIQATPICTTVVQIKFIHALLGNPLQSRYWPKKWKSLVWSTVCESTSTLYL